MRLPYINLLQLIGFVNSASLLLNSKNNDSTPTALVASKTFNHTFKSIPEKSDSRRAKRILYTDANEDAIIFPTEEEQPQSIPLRYQMNKNRIPQVNPDSSSQHMEHPPYQQIDYWNRMSVSDEEIIRIIKHFYMAEKYKDMTSKPSGSMNSLASNSYGSNLHFQQGNSHDIPYNNYYPYENESFEDYNDIRYNSIIFVGTRPASPPCPRGYRRTHKGICRRVTQIRG